MEKVKLNKSDYQFIGLYLFIASCWLIFSFSGEGYSTREYFIDIPVFQLKILSAFLWIKKVFERFILQSRNYFLFFLLSLLGFLFIGSLVYLSGLWSAGHFKTHSFPAIHQIIIQGLNSSFFDTTFFLGLFFGKKSYEKRLENKDLEIKNQQNALQLLRNQFSPHFLFNNLNTIDGLIDHEPEKAKQSIHHLANLYRYFITSEQEDVVLLSHELAFVKSYIFLIHLRFQDTYVFQMDIQQAIEQLYVPPGALQTLIENVVKHNKASNDLIKTTISVRDNAIAVKNNKSKILATDSTKTGIDNLRKRFQLLTDRPLLVQDTEQYFEIIIPLLT